MTNSASETKRGANRPLSIRFTDEEKVRLRERAGAMPLGTYIRSAVLGDVVKSRSIRPQPVRNADQLGRLLGMLGSSRLASNLNQLAKAANQGSLPVTQELEAELKEACAQVADMRSLLMVALGMRQSESLIVSDDFQEAARP
jgi:hypothetical protein